jgi:PAS domain S-box-containing protein
MADHALEPSPLTDLRIRAASRLTGPTDAKGPAAIAPDALAVLHAMASSPGNAADALALLHELQVHQVELDLQAQELRESRAELESALRRQIELYDFQPVGCFSIDQGLRISEVNQAGAKMLGVDRNQAHGLGLDTFVSAASLRKLLAIVSKVADGGSHAAGTLEWRRNGGLERPVHADVCADPSGNGYFVVLTYTDGGRAPEPPKG